jgi:hypothetical protein
MCRDVYVTFIQKEIVISKILSRIATSNSESTYWGFPGHALLFPEAASNIFLSNMGTSSPE